MFNELLAPFKEIDEGNGEEVLVFKAPVGKGAPPMIALEDLGRYARWMIENPERSSGMNLKVATTHVSWDELAKEATIVTGRKAIFRDLSLNEYFSSGIFSTPDAKVGERGNGGDDTLQTYRENFSGFWNTWREDVLKRDLTLLDDILPGRIRTLGEWMTVSGYTGERSSVLKDYRDAVAKPGKV
jgi:hypothetical protein